MVFFTCSNCGESMKKKDVEKHWFRCKFNSISCVDCQKDFTKQTYGSHTTCLTEDQKYQGKLYTEKESANKGQKKQDAWMTNIVNYANTGKESKQISGYLHNLSNYNNIPRKKAKFVNFAKSCLRIHDEMMITRLWNAIEMANKDSNPPAKSDDKVAVDSEKVSTEDQAKEKTEETGPSTSNVESEITQPPSDDTNHESSSESSKKKKKKKQIEESVEESKDTEEPMNTDDSNVESKDLNTDPKEKRKKRKVEEAVADESTSEELSQVDESLVQGDDEPSKKKKKKDKKRKSMNEEESTEQVQSDEQQMEEGTTETTEKTDSDNIAGDINTETNNEEPRKKDKKKKKQKATDDSIKLDESTSVDTSSTNGVEVENQDANTSQVDQKGSDTEAGEPSYSKGGKFKWMKAIKKILKEQEDKKISLKKLQKKIFKMYESSCQENEQLTKRSKEDCFAQVEKFISEAGKRRQDRKIKMEDGVVIWKVA